MFFFRVCETNILELYSVNSPEPLSLATCKLILRSYQLSYLHTPFFNNLQIIIPVITTSPYIKSMLNINLH